jgi:hypothetical protein
MLRLIMTDVEAPIPRFRQHARLPERHLTAKSIPFLVSLLLLIHTLVICDPISSTLVFLFSWAVSLAEALT